MPTFGLRSRKTWFITDIWCCVLCFFCRNFFSYVRRNWVNDRDRVKDCEKTSEKAKMRAKNVCVNRWIRVLQFFDSFFLAVYSIRSWTDNVVWVHAIAFQLDRLFHLTVCVPHRCVCVCVFWRRRFFFLLMLFKPTTKYEFNYSIYLIFSFGYCQSVLFCVLAVFAFLSFNFFFW